MHQDRTSPSLANFSAPNRASQVISAMGIIFPYTQRESLFASDFDRKEIILEPQESLDFSGSCKLTATIAEVRRILVHSSVLQSKGGLTEAFGVPACLEISFYC